MSSFALAMPFAVGAACVYGTSIVVQHRSASEHGGGDESAKGLLRLLRDPIWVAAVLGDFVGFVLNAIALSIGKVVYVQPFVVLMLPVALLVHWWMGGSPPRRGDYLGCGAIISGLALFLALIGVPHHQRIPRARWVGMAVLAVLVGGLLLCLLVRKAGPRVRGAVYGAVAGAYFGTIAVMLDASSDIIGGTHHHEHRHHGIRGGLEGLFMTLDGLMVVAAIVLLGVAGIVLTQISFQVGALAATLPANLVADPLFGVFLGAVLLREYVPVTPLHVVAYVACLALILAGGVRLAAPAVEPVPGHHAHASASGGTSRSAPMPE